MFKKWLMFIARVLTLGREQGLWEKTHSSGIEDARKRDLKDKLKS